MLSSRDLIDGYTEILMSRIANGWDPFLLTFMFDQLRGAPQSVARQMEREVERTYALLLTRIVRNPKTAARHGMLPVWIASPDYPVPRHDRSVLRDVAVNDGRHIHAVAVTPPMSRLKQSLSDHIEAAQAHYVEPGGPLVRLHAKPIVDAPDYVTEYVLKSIPRGRVDANQIIVLPRATSELSRADRSSPEARVMRERPLLL